MGLASRSKIAKQAPKEVKHVPVVSASTSAKEKVIRQSVAPIQTQSHTSATASVPLASRNNENNSELKAVNQELKSENEKLKLQNMEIELEIDRLEKERDFYFEKLRDIEMMLQDLHDNGGGSEMTENIFKILYATADGFEAAPDGNVESSNPIDTSKTDEDIGV